MSIPVELPNTASSTPADGAPPVLLPYQQKWIADPSPLKVDEKSRRTGLTWAEAADDVLIASAAKTAGGQNVYYIGYNMDMAIEYIEACAMWARAFHYAASEVEEGLWDDGEDDRHIKTYTIRFPDSSHRIVALSSRPANLRGKQGVIVIDEAAFHDQLGELLKAALALLIWGGKVRVISTHNGDDNAFNELVQEIRAGKRKGTVQRITFREAVEQGLYRRVCLRLGIEWTAEGEAAWMKDVYAFYGDAAEEELDVVPSHGSGVWLTTALIKARMRPERPVLRLTCDADFVHRSKALRESHVDDWCEEHLAPLLAQLDRRARGYLGEDFGRTGDLTVLFPGQELADLSLVVPFIVELRNVPFEQQRQVVFFLLDRLPRFAGAAFDARGNGHYLAEVTMQKYGAAHVLQVMPTEPWYRETMPKLKSRFEDGDIELPEDSEVLGDFRAVKVVKGVARVPELRTHGKEGQRHGDAAIAGAMLVHAVETCEAGPIEFQTTGDKRTGAGRSMANFMRS